MVIYYSFAALYIEREKARESKSLIPKKEKEAMIQFECTKCNKKYRVADNYAGKRVRCKDCETVNTIPSPETEKVSSGDSVAAFNQLLQELSQHEKTAPELDPNATATPS